MTIGDNVITINIGRLSQQNLQHQNDNFHYNTSSITIQPNFDKSAMRKFKAIASTTHYVIKFQTPLGNETLISEPIIIPSQRLFRINN